MLLVALLLQNAAAETYSAVAQGGACSGAVGCAGFYRSFTATTSPAGSTFGPPSDVYGVSVEGVGIQANSNGVTTNAHVDVAGFKFGTPGDTANLVPSLSFYFGYLGASGSWDTSTTTKNVSGAFLEVLSTVAAIAAYRDRDGTDGFQWDLTSKNDIFDCALPVGGKFDCIEFTSLIKVGSAAGQLTFDAIEKTDTPCSQLSANTSGYGPNCRLIELSTNAYLVGTNVTVLSIVARAATQPIMVNGILHSPLKLKWDVTVYPPYDSSWSTITNQASLRILLLFFHGGKAGVGVATSQGGGSNSLTFTATAGHAAYFGYVGWALTESGNVTVYTQTITGAQITNYQGTGVTATVAAQLQAQAAVTAAFGWAYQITIHSFVADMPAMCNWDPENGMYSTSASVVLVPSAVLVALLALW